MNKGLLGCLGVGAILLFIVLVGGCAIAASYNRLVPLQQKVDQSWAQVQNVYQRRADLIPNLVETVKGYAKQEQTVFGDIAKARTQLLSAGTPEQKISANAELDKSLFRLLTLVENYPQLKSNENFLRLQDELAGTENRIAVERQRYNDTLKDYNIYVQQFPNSIFASSLGFKPNTAYFAATEGSREVPKVNFATPQPQPVPAH